MPRAPWLLGALLACTPHEGSQAPGSPCPEGMALVEGDRVGAPPVPRLCVDLTEVTTAAYGACMHAGACTPAVVGKGADCNVARAGRGDHPVNCASWDQAQAFCAWAGKRVLEDEEWSWVARGGARGTVYPWGSAPLDAARACFRRGDGTCAAGGAPAGASPEGLLDLVGNVAEWTRGRGGGRLRGGSWADERPLQVAAGEATPGASAATGLRCAVMPNTPVPEVDGSLWAPYVPPAEGLPVLAARPLAVVPTRPLNHFAVLHRADGSSTRWRPIAGGYVAADVADERLALPEALDPSTLPEALRGFTPRHDLGAAVLMASSGWGPTQFIAVEKGSWKLRWQLAQEGATSYQQFVAPQVLVAEFYAAGGDALVGVGLGDGRELWRLVGGPAGPFTRVRSIWTDGERGFLRGDRGVMAFDLTTGATLWPSVPVGESCGVAFGDGRIVIEDAGAHRILDPVTGAVVGRTKVGALGECRAADPSAGRVAEAAVEAGRLFAFDRKDRRGDAVLRAVDLRSGAELWRRRDLDGGVLAADHDAVYASRGEEILVALDAATGATRAEVSIAAPFAVELRAAGGATGPLVLATSEATGTWILGRAAEPVAAEAFTVRGRLVGRGRLRGAVAGVRVRVGEAVVTTDAEGRFEARGRTLGAVVVTPDATRMIRGVEVRFDPTFVFLAGRRRYDVGALELYEHYEA
jgi:hypothetical protein